MIAFMSSVIQIGRVSELLLAVVHGLLPQRVRLHQLPLDDIVDIDELVVVGQVALEEVVDLRDDLRQTRLFLLLNGARARFGQRRQLRRSRLRQEARLASLDHSGYGGSAPPCERSIALALPAKLQQRQQPLVEDGSLLKPVFP